MTVAPALIIETILKILDDENEWSRCSRISKNWHRVVAYGFLFNTRALQTLFPNLTVMDKAVWESVADLKKERLTVKNEKPLKSAEVAILRALFASAHIDQGEGMTLLTVPCGLGFHNLESITREPKAGNSIIWFNQQHHMGGIAKKTYRVLVTNTILNGTRNSSDPELQRHVLNLGNGCRTPQDLHIAAVFFLNYVSLRNTLWAGPCPTYTRVVNSGGKKGLVAGGSSSQPFSFRRNDFRNPEIGVAAEIVFK